MSWKCHSIEFFCSSLSKPFLMSRHYSSGVATLSSDVLRDVIDYVVAMSLHCSPALLISIDDIVATLK